MADELLETKAKWWFWIVAIIALFWNLVGVGAYLGSAFGGEALLIDTYGAEGADVMLSRPAWATAAFAIAVFGGTLGAIALLMRKSWAGWLFVFSFIGVLVQNLWGFLLSDAAKYMMPADKVMTPMIVIFAIFLIWFAYKMAHKGILR